MHVTHVSEYAPLRNKKRTLPANPSVPFIPDVDPRHLQMMRLLAGFRFSPEHAALVATLAFGEGSSQ